MTVGKTVSRPSAALVGSVNLANAGDVFDVVGGGLKGILQRIPDGETGERIQWFLFQLDIMKSVAGIEQTAPRIIPGMELPQLKLADGVSVEGMEFPALGYASNAIDSFALFRERKESGVIAADARFQVSLPTPFAPIFGFFSGEDVRKVWPIYERAMMREVEEICRTIPLDQLAIQWDVASEIGFVLENPPVLALFPIEEMVTSVARLVDAIPAGAHLGLHLCYGDPGHEHLVQPKDTGVMVDFANRIVAAVHRTIHWIQMPVPRSRNDSAYFAPLEALKLQPETELYLGLVHATDGIDGAKSRIDAAKQYVAGFGVATECGWGRRPTELMPVLVDLHRQASELAA